MIEFVRRLRSESLSTLAGLLSSAEWEITDTEERRYAVWHGVLQQLETIDELGEIWPRERWHQAFFLSIPPGGYVHRHRDTDDVYTSFHVVISTNEECRVFEHTSVGETAFMLRAGGVYAFDRTREHSSANRGNSARVHLIMEILRDKLS